MAGCLPPLPLGHPSGSPSLPSPDQRCSSGSRGWGSWQVPGHPDLCPLGPQVEATEPQDVVVYDQSTRDASVLAADSFLSILLSKLDGCFDSVAILTGASGGLSPRRQQLGGGRGGSVSGVMFWLCLCSPL